MMFLIDFEKAFDKLEWSFIFKTLKQSNFGDDLIKWVKVFTIIYHLVYNGHASEFFNLFCGVRQGCPLWPLSPLFYIVCSKILNLTIRNNLEIKGVMVMDTEVTIRAYADETTLYLKDKYSLIRAIDVLHNFQTYSGLKVLNLDKSDILPFGLYRENPPDISDIDIGYTTNTVRLLGVSFNNNLQGIFELNYVPKLEKLKGILRIWSTRDLSPIGKIIIVKSFWEFHS